MNLNVKSIRFDADKKLINFIQKKADKLDVFIDQILDAECYLRVENTEDEANKVAEFKLNIPGAQLFAKGQAKSFEEATDIAVESLRRQINKHKTKTRTKASNHKELLGEPEEDF